MCNKTIPFDDQGKVHIDLWGWEVCPSYQRFKGRTVSPAFLKKRAIDESYKWGANLVEIYRGGFPMVNTAGWTKESTADFHRYVHEHDQVIHWFPHRLLSTGTFQRAIDAVRSLGREQLDSLRVPNEELIDGLGTEQWSSMATSLLFNKCMLPYSPFMYFYTDNHLFDETLPNEMDVSASNGSGTDDQTGSYYKLHDRIEKDYGLQFWGSQAECRPVVPNNVFGGNGYPDWVLKQMNDQFRIRARVRGKRNVSPSALWWISEAESTCPDNNRRYVYGISQDPIKCAVTAKLTILGTGRVSPPVRPSLPTGRYSYPSETAFIQNNYMRLMVLHDQDKTEILHDPERLAHYDNNSHAVPVCTPFCQTVILSSKRKAPKTPVTFKHIEPAGYKAVLHARLGLDFIECYVDEMRSFVILNDTPYIRLKIERDILYEGRPVALGTRIGLPAYDRLILGQTVYENAFTGTVPSIVRLKDSSGLYPDLVFMVLAKGRLTRIRWKPKSALTFESSPAEHDSFELALVIPDGLYDDGALPKLRRFLTEPEERVVLDENGQAVIANPFDIPLVKVVRVFGGGKHPYQLHEFDHWVFRGAQPSLVHEGEDYLKCYLPAKGSTRIQRYNFIDGIAKPGWGCQYTMALHDVRQNSVVAKVKEVTSFLFAPRVKFKNPVSKVKVNGKEWNYFEGHHVFLPNRRGEYRVEVVDGTANRPHLARTFAHIENSAWKKGRLTFEAQLPEWVTGIPDRFYFYALIRHAGQNLVNIENAELVRTLESTASIVRFKPGVVALTFGKLSKGKIVAEIDMKRDISDYLSHLSAGILLPYMGPFKSELVSLRAVGADKKSLAGYNVLLWHQYFLDSLPKDMAPETVKALREYVEQGGGLFLMANAVRLIPQLTNAEMEKMSTSHIGHHLYRKVKYFGVESAVDDHPVFQGMKPTASETRTFALISPSWDIFKRVLWQSSASDTGKCLATMHTEFKKGDKSSNSIYKSSPVLWEWQLGKGRVIGYSCGLRHCFGSPNRTKPSGNLLTFVQNITRHLAQKNNAIRVGVLW